MDYGKMTAGTPHLSTRKRYRATIDRIIPRTLGGRYTSDNVMIMCTGCNSIKGDKTFAEIVEMKNRELDTTRPRMEMKKTALVIYFKNYIEIETWYRSNRNVADL
jgi:hypothetical protein